MKRAAWFICLAALLLMAPPAKPAGRFDQVAEQVRRDLARAKAEQAATQRKMQARLAKLQGEVARLRAQVTQRQGQLEQTRQQLEQTSRQRAELAAEVAQKSGDLKELAGDVRASARDLLAMAETSPVTGEHPQRLARLKAFLPKGKFPSLADIKRLVDLYFVEIQETGRIRRRTGAMVNRDGVEVQGDILRLGGFVTIYRAGGEVGYLLPGPASGRLLAISGTVPWRVAANLEDYLDRETDTVYLDISGGGALRQLARSVSWTEHLLSGGPLIWPILLVGLLGLGLVVERLWFLHQVRANTDRLMAEVNQLVDQGDFDGARRAAEAQQGRPTSNVLLAGLALRGQPPEVIDNGLSEAILKELPRLERSLTTLKVLAAVAPLLGLLGTVTGMINTFAVITVHGTGDPRLMAGGISEAMVTTQLGLAVAIPLLVAGALLTRRAQRISNDMEEKAVALSAALIKEGGAA